MTRNKYYFLSDVHLGSRLHADSIETERKLCRWFDMVRQDAKAIYLMGDIFDYWFEYKYVVPKGFTRTLGKIAEITDAGIDVHFFIGNHDLWLTDYLAKECGMQLHFEQQITPIEGKIFFLAHGDGLGDDSTSFKILRHIFHSKIARKCFSSIHPRWTIPLAHAWSNNSRENGYTPDFLGEENEHLVKFAKQQLSKTPEVDYFIFGHRHIFLDMKINNSAQIFILGDWIYHFSYAVFDGENVALKLFEK